MNYVKAKRSVFVVLSLVLAFAVSGCSAKKPQPSGFLRNYGFMQNADKDETFFSYENYDRHRGHYSKLIIDPTIVYFHPEAKGVAVDPTQLKELANFFYIEIVSAVKDEYEIVEKPAIGVLRVRTAITDVIPNKPLLNIHWSTTLAGFGLGGATMEMEFLDSLTDERVAAVVDSRLGQRSINPRIYAKGWKKWGHTEDILTQWAQLIKDELDGLK